MEQVIPHWLTKQKELNPDKAAITRPGKKAYTFKDVFEESRAIAAGMRKAGLKKGDHIALLVENQIQYPLYIHAASFAGVVVVLLNTRLTPKELAYQLQDADVTALFSSVRTKELAEQTLRLTAPVSHFPIEHFSKGSTDTVKLQEELHFNEVYTMMYTSGTTGNPKAVMHTYGNHWYSAISSALNLGLNSTDQWLLCLPMFHVGGFSILMKSVIYGMTIELLEKFRAEDVHTAIMERGITHVSVVTVMLQKLLVQLGDEDYPSDFSCMLLGGGPVPEHMLHKCAEKNIPVYQTYGMTETSSQIATLSPNDAFRKIGSAGKALGTATLKIDQSEQGEVGEILVKGPMVADRYYNRPPQGDRFFRTGDLGYKDQEGFLFVVDRVKDVIISGGENIYPAEIENVLTGIPGVLDAGVTGRTDRRWGEVPVAFVVVSDREGFSVRKAGEYCAEHLAKYKIPKEFFILSELPRNASNKILRRELYAKYKEEYGED